MIHYIKGDATEPAECDGTRIIIHICNNIGKFGAGFAKAIAIKYPKIKNNYLKFYETKGFFLGDVQFVKIGEDLYVANMIGQNGVRSSNNPTPIDYNAFEICLTAIKDFISKFPDITIHAPRLGAGLAGGKWNKIEELLNKVLTDVNIYIYDLPNQKFKFPHQEK